MRRFPLAGLLLVCAASVACAPRAPASVAMPVPRDSTPLAEPPARRAAWLAALEFARTALTRRPADGSTPEPPAPTPWLAKDSIGVDADGWLDTLLVAERVGPVCRADRLRRCAPRGTALLVSLPDLPRGAAGTPVVWLDYATPEALARCRAADAPRWTLLQRAVLTLRPASPDRLVVWRIETGAGGWARCR